MPLLSLIFEICLLRKGPQHLPGSRAPAVASLAAYVAAGLVAQSMVTPDAEIVAPVLLDAGLSVALVMLALNARGHLDRVFETITAMMGTGTLFTLAAVPLLYLIGRQAEEQAAPAPVVLLWLGLVVWSFVVTAHILRHSLSVSLSVGLLWATLFLAASVAVFALVFGAQS